MELMPLMHIKQWLFAERAGEIQMERTQHITTTIIMTTVGGGDGIAVALYMGLLLLVLVLLIMGTAAIAGGRHITGISFTGANNDNDDASLPLTFS